jgi:hypothetical protein
LINFVRLIAEAIEEFFRVVFSKLFDKNIGSGWIKVFISVLNLFDEN